MFKHILLLTTIISLYACPYDGITQSITLNKFIPIGGIQQWISVKGDRDKPVILFIHGGPGSVLSPFADNIFREWKEDFVLAHWDQRGAGRTFGENAPDEVDEDYWMENPLSLNQMVDDGLEVTQYLLNYLNKEKVILIGTSWGSILGTKMVLKKPELFHAYIGHSQIVSYTKNLEYAYEEMQSRAKKSSDTTLTDKLGSLGKPPYDNARDLGQLLRLIKMYENKNSTPAPSDWWEIGIEYNNEVDSKNRYNGDDYSFLYYAGHKKLGIEPMAADIDFDKDSLEFKVPIFIVQGEQDILTSKEITKSFFDHIKSPQKKYFLIPDAAHGFNQSVIDQCFQIVSEHIHIQQTKQR